MVTWDTLDCRRDLLLPTQGQCTLIHQGWISKSQRSWPLQQIQGVDVETDGFQKNGSPRYRAALMTTEGNVQLPINPDSPPVIAEEMQQFLDNAQQLHFEKQWDGRPYAFFCVKICLLFAGLFGILGKRVTLEISKYSQRFTVRRRNLLGTRVREYPLDQIVDVIVQKKRGGKFGPMGRSVLVMKDGKKIVIHAYDLFYPEARAHESVALMRYFLNL
ncbi:MAG TPA: hypothetical protein V6C88_06115 [Chroococcidiopsis sp.]